MDGKEIKRVLKEAKEAIKSKDTKTAIKLCKSVLKDDRDNYVALVLFGASLQESDQHEEAPKAYKKASEVSPDQPLAWQGLVSYYEKHKKNIKSEFEGDVLRAYAYLLPQEIDGTKKHEMAMKLSELAIKLQSSEECLSLLPKLQSDMLPVSEIRRCFLKALFQMKDLKETDSIVIQKALEQVVLDWRENPKGNDYDIQEFYRQYLKHLYRSKDYEKLFKEAKLMAETFSKDPYPLEWICKLWVEFVAEGKDIGFIKDTIEKYVNTLEIVCPAASSVSMAKGAMHFCRSELVKAREELNKALTSGQSPWHVYLLLADVELKFGLPQEALSLLSEAKMRVKQLSTNQEYVLKRCEAETLIGTLQQENLNRAAQLCKELLSEKNTDVAVHLLYARACVQLKNFEEAQKQFIEIGTSKTCSAKVTLLHAQILCLSGQSDKAAFVLESIASDAKDAEIWLALARLHGNSGKQNNVLTDLMEAARCEPFYWETFMLLGNQYKKISTPASLDKARRCYQKALQLNPKSLQIAKHLSDVLLQLHDVESNIQLLDMMTQTSNEKWIWLRLGLLHSECGEVEKAINFLCNAVRSDPSDCRIWESLGDAYMLRGSWHAALKSFMKVKQLSPENIYAAYQIGTVKLRMEEFEDALIAFRQLIELSEDYVPGLQGQGEAAFRWAQVLRQEQRIGCAKDRCQEAIDAFTKVLNKRQDLSCTWKLLGDTCLLGAKLPPFYASFHVTAWIVCPSASSNRRETSLQRKMDMFLLAERMYCRAMSISQDSSLIWHDLASTNFWHAMAVQKSNKRNELLQRAMTGARQAVTLNPKNAMHWNLLGVVAATEEIKKWAVAQHAFIQSILLDNSSPLAWTNLGTLYLMIGDIQLANKAFSAAQRVDHSYTRCWVGQAMIAETMDHHETLDLFRHAASLEYHHESCSGYAHWVLTTLLNNEKLSKIDNGEEIMVIKDMKSMYALEVAADCMKWYTERHASNPCGWNMLGLLLERQRLFQSSQRAFQRGLEEAILQGSDSVPMNAIRCNLGRILVNLKDYEKAVDILQQVTVPSFASQSGLALALYKAEKFEEAYGAYSSALEWLAPDEETKALILMAMAAMQYSFGQLEDCKTLLFQSIQPRPLSAHPLLALCAIGLLNQDITMSKIMLKELGQFKDDPRYIAHIGLLASYTAFIQNDQTGALRALSKAIHRHPGEGGLWLALSQVQMHAHPNCDAAAIRRTAQAAIDLGRGNMDITKIQSIISVAHLLSNDVESASISSQKALHQYPNIAENWATFVASVLPKDKSSTQAAKLRDTISHVRRRLQPSAGGLKKWLGNCEHHLASLSSP
ncbi:tetratricopeptide repeat protein 37 [Frankliniella occidentalis]|uniref:Tetratricopeptide repeat protein 37 n=1 Tax=Frankliniella occidentalis TaxID=133901 RepID=A0A6J1T565_FRAOC|nr:tetratricopeptide repeat protein 37 [Frankliniella occidentalis]